MEQVALKQSAPSWRRFPLGLSFRRNVVRKRKDRVLTYKGYKKLPPDVHCELIRGKLYMMASPTVFHQGLSMVLSSYFYRYLEDKPCRVLAAPMDVRLFAPVEYKEGEEDKEDDNTVVEPDLLIVCDEKKRHEERIHGAPDLVVEILSPSNRALDLKDKLNLYLEAGVKEYWVVEPKTKTVIAYRLRDGKYLASTYEADEMAAVETLPGCQINLDAAFKSMELPV
jgi:Uma2 family endonuclease